MMVPEAEIFKIPDMLAMFTPQRCMDVAAEGAKVYQTYFGTLDIMVETLLREIEQVLAATKGAAAGASA